MLLYRRLAFALGPALERTGGGSGLVKGARDLLARSGRHTQTAVM